VAACRAAWKVKSAQELRETMDKLDLPPGMSVIATAGIGRSVEELQWDLNYLMQLWRAIEGAGKSASGAFLIYQESSLVIRAIRDYFQPDIGEILIDTDEIYEQAHQFMSHVMPDMVHRVKRYSDDVPLFSRFQIEHQIETAYSHRAAAIGRRHRDRPHRSAGVGRRQLGPRHPRFRHRNHRFPHQLRSGRRSRPPAAPARPGRPDRDRLHRHGSGQEPARSGTAPERRCTTTVPASRWARFPFGLMELSRQRCVRRCRKVRT
jgi:hypothetical protein